MAATIRRGPWGNLLIAAGVLILLTAGAAWYLLPVQYEAFALLKVERTPPAVLARGPVDEKDFAVFKRTQVQLVLSYVVLNGTLREPSINQLSIVQQHKDDPVTWLKERLTINYPNNAELMRIAMQGTNREDVVKIVDRVAETYLQEIVYRDKQVRLENEEKLKRAYDKQKADYEKQLVALANLQKIHKTSGSGAAQLKKALAMDDLSALSARRNQIADEIRQTNLEIELAKARGEMTKDVRTGDSVAAQSVAATEPLSLALLMLKVEILEAQFAKVEKEVDAQTNVLLNLERFSEKVGAKQEEIAALRSIKNQLGTELGRADVERLAPDRITQVDRAVLADNRGDALRRAMWLGATATFGLALVGLGLVLRLPRRQEA